MINIDADIESADWAKTTFDFPFVKNVDDYMRTFNLRNKNEIDLHVVAMKKTMNPFWRSVPQHIKDGLHRHKDSNLIAVNKGEVAGHPFRGNQWVRGTSGGGSGLTASTGKVALSKSLRAIENGDPSVAEAVTLYCGEQNRYKRINRELRESKGKKVSGEAKQIDSAFEQFGVTLDRPVTVYRGAVLSKKVLEQIKKTGTFVEHGYSSTTLRQSLAREFSEYVTPSNTTGEAPRGKANVVFEVVLPKGTVVLGGNHRGGREEELILPRGTKFRYVETYIGYKLEVVSK